VTSDQNIHRELSSNPEASEVAIGSCIGTVQITLCWCGRRDPGSVVSDVIRRTVAAGVQWRADVYWWRWEWTRGLLRPRRVAVTSSDHVATLTPKIQIGSITVHPGGQRYMIIGRASSTRAWWRRALIAVAIRLLAFADRGTS